MIEIQCPHCQQPIDDEDALFCHFCGESLHRSSSGVFGAMNQAGVKWIVVTIVLIGLVILIATFF